MKKTKVKLYIDTSDSTETIVGILSSGKKKLYEEKTNQLKSQNLLPLIEKVLKKENLAPSDLGEIKIKTGPGSFTGLRVGAAVGNTLGWLQSISINGKPPGNFFFPSYQDSKF